MFSFESVRRQGYRRPGQRHGTSDDVFVGERLGASGASGFRSCTYLLKKREMKNIDLELVDEFAFGKIDRKEFLQHIDRSLDFSELIELSIFCKVISNNRRFEVFLWHFPKRISNKEKEIFYRWLLLENWHEQHDEIIGAFQHQFHQATENIRILKWAIENIPDYLMNTDLRVAYVKKCMYAIAAQSQPEAMLALQDLEKSEDDIISKLAKDQLARLAGK